MLDVVCHTIGFGCDYMDCHREWERMRGVDDDGVVLVRPDHFVAWRCAGPVTLLVFLSLCCRRSC